MDPFKDEVETVRKAATILRERAESSTPGEWLPFGTSIGVTVDGCTCAGPIPGYPQHESHCGTDGPTVDASEEDIAYIGTVQPTIGLALADLLASLAYDREEYGVDGSTWDHDVMPLARLIVRSDS